MKKNVLLILVSLVIFSCNTKKVPKESAAVRIESTLIAKGSLYGNGAEGITEQHIVIDDQTAWNRLISQMNSVNQVSNSFSEVDIDFTKYKVIAVFDTIKSNGGYSIALHISSNAEKIIISITDIVPEGNATAVMNQPYHIVKITKSELPIFFE